MDAEDRRVPFIDEKMRTVGKSALRNLVVFVPISAAEVPVGEPFLLGLQVLHLQVKDAVMRDESFETSVVMSGNPIDAESAEGSAYATEVVFVHIRFVAELVNRREQVFHTLTSIVSANLFIPRLAEAGQTATVGRYDDIIAGRHHHEVPSKRPELRDRALRTALAVEDGRVFLARVEMRRIDDPRQHIFSVRRLLPSRHYFRALNLIVDIIVLMRELRYLHFLRSVRLFPVDTSRTEVACWTVLPLRYIQSVYLIGLTHRVPEQEEVMVAHVAQREVILAFGHPLGKTVQVLMIQVHGAGPASRVEKGSIVVPHELIHIVLRTLTEPAFFARLEVHRHQAVLIALIAVALHGLPGNPLAVRRISRVGVVTLVVRGDVPLLARAYIK